MSSSKPSSAGGAEKSGALFPADISLTGEDWFEDWFEGWLEDSFEG